MPDFFEFFGVADGARTHDNWNHNPGLYQLSYSHLWYCFGATFVALFLLLPCFRKKLNNEEAEL